VKERDSKKGTRGGRKDKWEKNRENERGRERGKRPAEQNGTNRERRWRGKNKDVNTKKKSAAPS